MPLTIAFDDHDHIVDGAPAPLFWIRKLPPTKEMVVLNQVDDVALVHS